MAEDRFDRLESKIDKLTDAVSRLVVIEDRQTNQAAKMAALETTVERHGDRLTSLEHANIRWQTQAISLVLAVGVAWELLRFWFGRG